MFPFEVVLKAFILEETNYVFIMSHGTIDQYRECFLRAFEFFVVLASTLGKDDSKESAMSLWTLHTTKYHNLDF